MNVSDSLRLRAAFFLNPDYAKAFPGELIRPLAPELEQAADTIDRLRAELADRDRRIAELEARIDAAPHEMGCGGPYGQPCCCWKNPQAALSGRGG